MEQTGGSVLADMPSYSAPFQRQLMPGYSKLCCSKSCTEMIIKVSHN